MSLLSRDRQILERILEYCRKIGRTVARFGDSHTTFASDPDYVDSISMNLLQIGELAGRLSEDYIASCKEKGVNWRAIKNMRNMFAHDYGAMDVERIWVTATEDVPDLERFCETEIRGSFD